MHCNISIILTLYPRRGSWSSKNQYLKNVLKLVFPNKGQTKPHHSGSPLGRRITASKTSKLRQTAMIDNTSARVPTVNTHVSEGMCVHTEKHTPHRLLHIKKEYCHKVKERRDFHAMKGFMELMVSKHEKKKYFRIAYIS